MYQSRKIHSYFNTNSSSHPDNCPENEVCREDSDDHSHLSVNAAIEKLQSIVRISSNKKTEKQTYKTRFEFIRHLAVLRFLKKVHNNPRSRVKSSKDVAEQSFGGGEHRAKSIRNWSDEYVRTHQMMVLRQGKHQKTESLIDDSDIGFVLLAHLRTVRPETIDDESLATWRSRTCISIVS